LLFLLTLPAQVLAAGSISDGLVSVDITAFGANGMSINTNGFGSTDQVFSVGYWYRADSDTQEYPVTGSTPDSESYVGDTATLGYDDVGGRGLFSAEVVVTVEDRAPVGAQILYSLSLTPLDGIGTADVFFYADPDLDSGSGDDSAELIFIDDEVTTDAFLVYDQSCMEIAGLSLNNDPVEILSADSYQAASFSALVSALNDAFVTDLDNSGLPFGPGDFTGAFQFADQGFNLQWYGVMNFTEQGQVSSVGGRFCGATEVTVPGPGPVPLAILALLMLGGAWHFRGRFI